MEDNAVGSFWKILINATTYALRVLIHQGTNNESISSIFSFLRKILRKCYSQFFKRRGPFVPMVNSFDVGTLVWGAQQTLFVVNLTFKYAANIISIQQTFKINSKHFIQTFL